MKTPTPFYCDITSGTHEEQQEFKRLYSKASKTYNWDFDNQYYGYDNSGCFWGFSSTESAIEYFTRILPLSEGIAILKQIVGEEEKAQDNYVMLPRKLTAENGAKGLLSGEFFEEIQVENMGYCGCGKCDFCVEFPDTSQFETKKVPVSWSTIKAIYDMIVENLQPKP